ncbi:cobalt ABC transporter permease [Clostridium sardiniense]|uniref:cobalt ABC transporter permease n=1 Tax=Clostridium sardiniense TaxID=29369 RepID=UPI001A9C7239|nr:cobalt ABC transporter permease [Clostridium sardiniense]MBM7835702.1 hypothetical protein [Clostridium sardiniense]
MKDVFINQILSSVLSALALGFTSALVVLIKKGGDAFINFLDSKKDLVNQELKNKKYEHLLIVARSVWNIVEENFRITENVTDIVKSKQDEFDKLLLEKVPYLTKNQIADVRQAIAGEVNKGKTMLNEDDLKKQATELAGRNNDLESENDELKNKLSAIANYVPTNKQ